MESKIETSDHKIFDPSSFINSEIAQLKMIDMEISKDEKHGIE
jgi:hypothetical protein